MSKVSGFEVLKIFNGTTFAGQVVDVSAMNSGGRNAIQTIEFQGAINHNTTVAGLGSGGSLQFAAPNTGTVTVAVAGAATGASDSINLALKGPSGTFNVGGKVSLADVETVNITVDRPSNVVTQLDLSASAARSITVSGTGSLTFMDFQNDATQFNGPALTSMDASGLAGAIRFSLKNAVSAPVTLKGGSGNDELAAASAQAAVTIDGGGGNDFIVGGTKADTLSGGSGNDFIITGTGADIVDVGSGFDTVQLSVNNDSRANFVTVSGMGFGDKLDFANNGTSVASFVATKVSLAAGASFAAHLDAATTGGVNRVTWFQFEGNTYAVHDRTSFAGFSNGADQFVKLVGLIDLSGSTFSNDANVVLTL
jgi:Ca2+-binding RTX toxin-like protein